MRKTGPTEGFLCDLAAFEFNRRQFLGPPEYRAEPSCCFEVQNLRR